MSHIEHILVATDFSLSAGRAVERAALVAHQHRAKLHLLHAMPVVNWQMFGRVLIEHPLVTEAQLLESVRERLKHLADVLHEHYGVPLQHQVCIGRAHEQIIKYAQSHPIDLTVLGAHGENFVRDLFVGATAMKVLRKTVHPTLIVRSEVTKTERYRDILVPVDFSDASRLALEEAAGIATQAAIHVLHVYEVEFEGRMLYAGIGENVIQQYRDAAAQEARRMMDEFVAMTEGRERMSSIIRHGHPARTIIDQAQALRADLVVMGKRGRSELDELLLGSVTKHVLDEIDRDLLLVVPSASGISVSKGRN